MHSYFHFNHEENNDMNFSQLSKGELIYFETRLNYIQMYDREPYVLGDELLT